METRIEIPDSVRQKLDAFEHLREEFKQSFRFVQEVHGQGRLTEFPIVEIVRYLHALWVCECKGRLLSVAGRGLRPGKENEGKVTLELLRGWQVEGDTASV